MRASVRIALVLALVSAWAFMAVQFAAAEPIDTSTARTAVQYWPEGEPTSTVLIVTLELPEETQLPATVRLPLPAGAQITWAGEVMGGDIANDIGRPFGLVEGEGGESVEFTLEETLTAQYDATYDPVAADRGEYAATLEWTQTEPTEDVQFNVRMPGTVANIVIEPAPAGDPEINSFGERLYSLSPVAMQPGETASVKVTYERPELAGTAPTGNETLIPWLLGALGVAVVVLLVVAVVTSRRGGGDSGDES